MKTWHELEFDLEYDYQPEEEATRTYPGCDEAVYPTKLTLFGHDISHVLDAVEGETDEQQKARFDFISCLEDAAIDDAHRFDNFHDAKADDGDYLYDLNRQDRV